MIEISREKWQTLTLAQQLGNIGAEISRARHWEQRQDQQSRDEAICRAIDLLDFTIDIHSRDASVGELTRLKEVIGDWLCQTRQFDVSPECIQNYCLHLTLNPYRGERSRA